MNKAATDWIFYILLLITQIIACFFYGFYHKHIQAGDPKAPIVAASAGLYPWFQDIHIMVFVGMGFLFAFLKRFRLTGITEVFWIAAITVQYYFLWTALFDGAWAKPKVWGDFNTSFGDLIRGEFCAISMIIAIGAVIGKTNNLQQLIIVIVGILIYSINEHILFVSLDVSDVGGSMYIFAFGAFYGIGASWLLNYAEAKNNHNYVTSINSNSFAMIGTLFLWCFFPSFNSARAADVFAQNRAVVNTYFCLIGSVLGAYLISKILHKGKYHMEHILNATLVGGVLIASGADILGESWIAYLVGFLAGIISALMFRYWAGILNKLGLVDVAGVFHTFGVPGIVGTCLSAIYRARYFPGDERRGGIQIAGIAISFALSLVSGLLVGLIVRFLGSYETHDEYYNDQTTAHFDDPVEYNQNPQPFYDSQRRLIFGHVHQRKVYNNPIGEENRYVNDREAAPNL